MANWSDSGTLREIYLSIIDLLKKWKYRVSKLEEPSNIEYLLFCHVRGYLEVVNKHYQTHSLGRPFDHKSDSDAAILLREQEKCEKEPAQRTPLNDKMMVKMYEFFLENNRGFRATAWDFTNLGKYGGFQEHEFAMASRTRGWTDGI